jgi:hypothetical protein
MRYVNLMGDHKPHLLVGTVNNLGAETRVQYAPSTRYYLADKLAGKPWITRLPFPVHVVERVETYDHISRNRFVTRYAYHHGYFDGEGTNSQPAWWSSRIPKNRHGHLETTKAEDARDAASFVRLLTAPGFTAPVEVDV